MKMKKEVEKAENNEKVARVNQDFNINNFKSKRVSSIDDL